MVRRRIHSGSGSTWRRERLERPTPGECTAGGQALRGRTDHSESPQQRNTIQLPCSKCQIAGPSWSSLTLQALSSAVQVGVPTVLVVACSRYPLPKIMVQAVTEAATVQNARTSVVCQRLSGCTVGGCVCAGSEGSFSHRDRASRTVRPDWGEGPSLKALRPLCVSGSDLDQLLIPCPPMTHFGDLRSSRSKVSPIL